MFTGITSLDLAMCLGTLAPVQLIGVELLSELRPSTGAWFPQVSLEVLTKATTQIVDYTKACALTLRTLQTLPPVILTGRPCLDFCL